MLWLEMGRRLAHAEAAAQAVKASVGFPDVVGNAWRPASVYCQVKLSIELDKPGNVYMGGETISGKVILEADNAGDAPIYLNSGWKTSGMCNTESAQPEHMKIAHGWRAGRSILPFSFTASNGPFSYHGELFEVNWELQAKVGQLLGIEAKKTLELLPNPIVKGVVLGSNKALPKSYDEQYKSQWFSRILIWILILITPLLFITTIWTSIKDDSFNILRFILYTPIVLMLAYVYFKVARDFITETGMRLTIGDIALNFGSLVTRRGAKIAAIATIKKQPTHTRQSMNLIGIHAYLDCYERSILGYDKNRTYHEKRMIRHALTMVKKESNRPGIQFEIPLAIPTDAVISFVSTSANVEWCLTIEYPVWGQLIWKRKQVFHVIP
jgi:hypothetical protein